MQQRTTPWGATGQEWDHFSRLLALTDDLLPVVSRPDAKISPKSKMAALGKTPSTFNRDREVVGIPQWTQHHSSERDITRWARDSDLGICVQTREVRAIDVDIEDRDAAARVMFVIEEVLGFVPPMRWRADSGKFLFAVRMPGEFTKRIIRTEHGAIEFLANGQQFVAVGTHPKGARYEWDDGVLPASIPVVTPAQFEALWAQLDDLFAIEPGQVGRGAGARPLVPRNPDDVNDPVVTYLDERGWVKGYQRDGRVDVRCPWEGEHTTDTGDSATTWFPAGMGGFAQGHFRCLHAHCEHKGDTDFLEAVGYISDAFEVVPVAQPGEVVEEGQEPPPMPVFQRKRSGEIIANVHNVLLALRRPDVCGWHLAHDNFTDALMVAEPDVPRSLAQWRPMRDADYTTLRATLERKGFGSVGRELIRDSVLLVATEQVMDTAIEWLDQRVPAWDGVDRVSTFWSRYFGAADTPYTRAVSVYTWSALAGRVLDPGCKVDMVPVLIAGEGSGKTSGVAALVPSEKFFAQLRFDMKDDDLARRMRGTLVGELAELRGLHTKDREAILDWITRRHERWTPKFKEFDTSFPRRLLMIGTTNEEQFLDDTGAEDRRWLPLRVGNTDMAALDADREQIWAQGRELFKEQGIAWRGAYELAREVRGEHRLEDPWASTVWQWLCRDGMDESGAAVRGLQGVRSSDILVGALGLQAGRVSKADEMRLGRVMKALGFERRVVREKRATVRVWVACEKALVGLKAQSGADSAEDLA